MATISVWSDNLSRDMNYPDWVDIVAWTWLDQVFGVAMKKAARYDSIMKWVSTCPMGYIFEPDGVIEMLLNHVFILLQ